MWALLVIDMQNGVCRTKGQTLFRLKDLVTLVNCRIRWFREQGLQIIFIQHQNMNLTRGTIAWQLLSELDVREEDLYVNKTQLNAFYQTDLQSLLIQRQGDELEICGAQTEYCVDTTIKMAHGLGYRLEMVPGASSTVDNKFLTVRQTIQYFEEIWGQNFLKFISPDLQSKCNIITRKLHCHRSTIGRELKRGRVLQRDSDYFTMVKRRQPSMNSGG